MSFFEKLGHGGDLLTASQELQIDPDKLIDFSANINPLGPPDNVMDLLRNNLHEIIHYPDPSYRILREQLANGQGLSPASILVGNGAAECMSLALQALHPKCVGVVYPCFSEYEFLSYAHDIPVIGVVGDEKENFIPKYSDFVQLFENVDLVFIGHPNNPNGSMYSFDDLIQLAELANKYETTLIIDEAFIDFIPFKKRATLSNNLAEYPKVLIIRSMTKFYSIPGLRLGYALGNPEIINKIQKKQVTWSVNQLALIAGQACLLETDFSMETINFIQQEKAYLKEKLSELGIYVFPGNANFLLCRLPHGANVTEFQLNVGKKGILIRSCSMYNGLTDRDFRIAVKNRNDNNLLITILHTVLNEMGYL